MAVQIGAKLDGSDLWTLPIEPKIAIEAANEIVRRQVDRNYAWGSVKELFNKGDYEIVIEGVFIAELDAEERPQRSADVSRLNELCSLGQALKIVSADTQAVGVDQVVVVSWSFPFTKGTQNQHYVIKCLSDYPFELVIA